MSALHLVLLPLALALATTTAAAAPFRPGPGPDFGFGFGFGPLPGGAGPWASNAAPYPAPPFGPGGPGPVTPPHRFPPHRFPLHPYPHPPPHRHSRPHPLPPFPPFPRPGSDGAAPPPFFFPPRDADPAAGAPPPGVFPPIAQPASGGDADSADSDAAAGAGAGSSPGLGGFVFPPISASAPGSGADSADSDAAAAGDAGSSSGFGGFVFPPITASAPGSGAGSASDTGPAGDKVPPVVPSLGGSAVPSFALGPGPVVPSGDRPHPYSPPFPPLPGFAPPGYGAPPQPGQPPRFHPTAPAAPAPTPAPTPSPFGLPAFPPMKGFPFAPPFNSGPSPRRGGGKPPVVLPGLTPVEPPLPHSGDSPTAATAPSKPPHKPSAFGLAGLPPLPESPIAPPFLNHLIPRVSGGKPPIVPPVPHSAVSPTKGSESHKLPHEPPHKPSAFGLAGLPPLPESPIAPPFLNHLIPRGAGVGEPPVAQPVPHTHPGGSTSAGPGPIPRKHVGPVDIDAAVTHGAPHAPVAAPVSSSEWHTLLHGGLHTTYSTYGPGVTTPAVAGLTWGVQCRGLGCRTRVAFVGSLPGKPPLLVADGAVVETNSTAHAAAGEVACPRDSFAVAFNCNDDSCTALTLSCKTLSAGARALYAPKRTPGRWGENNVRTYCADGEYVDGVQCAGPCTTGFNVLCSRVEVVGAAK